MGCHKEELQNLKKYHLAFKTPMEGGLAKAPRPPFIKKIKEPQKAETKVSIRGWFPLEPYTAG